MASSYQVSLRLRVVAGLAFLLLLCCDCASELSVTIDVVYELPADFNRTSAGDFRNGSGPVILTCQVEGANGTVTYQWTSTCTGDCFVLRSPQTNPSVTQNILRAGIDDGTHTCTATDSGGGTGSARFVMRIIIAPNPPENFLIIVISSDTLQFSWDPPDFAIGLNLYKLSCRSIFPPDLQRNSSKEYHLDNSNRTMLINDTQSGFSPGVTYECSVLSSNTAGDGLPVVQIVTTHPELPTGPPQSFEISGGPRNLTFSWTQIAPELRNGNITSYIITCDPTAPLVPPAGISFPGMTTNVSLGRFTPYTNYSCQVVGRNSIGPSPPAPASIQTPEDVPEGPPLNFETTTVIPETVSFSWEPPAAPNGRVTYSIECSSDGGTSPVLDMTTELSITLTGFTPAANYTCVLTPSTNAGPGPTATVVIVTLPEAPTITNVTVLNSTHLLVNYDPPPRSELVTQYTVYLDRSDRGLGELVTTTVGPKLFLMVGPVLPFEEVTVQVSATTAGGEGPRSEGVTKRTDEDSAVRNDSDDSGTVAVAGAVGGALLAVVVVLVACCVAVVVFLRLRCFSKNVGRKPRSTHTETANNYTGGSGLEMRVVEAVVPTYDYFEDSDLMVGQRRKAIPVAQFGAHVTQMHQNRDKGYALEYSSLPSSPLASNDTAMIPCNRVRNRFANIFPYDFNRVKLQATEGEQGSDYINASYLDGYSRASEYIASQGPLPHSLADFVRMIWELKLSTMVMLTRCIEKGKDKCEQYWPEKVNEKWSPPDSTLTLTLISSLPLAEYAIRNFSIKDTSNPGQPPLIVTHLQYLAWPDHGAPRNCMSLISFIKQARKYHPVGHKSPLLVHCSAGVGRTGTFVVLDSMMQKMKVEGSFNVYGFLSNLRKQRVLLVQTENQYVFIHDALSELVTCGQTEIAAGDLYIATNILSNMDDGTKITGFQKQFEILEQVSHQTGSEDFTETLAAQNFSKNRYPDKMASDWGRVRLMNVPCGSDYINASFINSYKGGGAFIAAQAPVRASQSDFWRMVKDYRSHCIVMLCNLTENGAESSYLYWPQEVSESLVFGKLMVTLRSEEDRGDYCVRKIEVSESRGMAGAESITVTQFHCTQWPVEGQPSPASLLKLNEELIKAQMASGNKAITVMCNDGMGRTGAFICIHAQLERLKTEGVVDFFQFIKSSRVKRPGMVQTVGQYMFCHTVISEYIGSFRSYSNFQGIA